MNNVELKYNVYFTLGDPSRDGHGQTQEYHFRSNYSAKQIDELFKRLNSELGINVKKWCEDYEEDTLNEDQYSKLLSIGVIKEDDENLYLNDNQYYVEDKTIFVDLAFSCIKHICPDFEYKYNTFNENCINTLQGAAYGLFYD